MFNRRNFVLAGVLAVLAGCAQTQLVDVGTASSLRVTEVSVTTRVARKNTAIPKQRILDTVQAKSFAALSRANPAGNRPVRAEVTVNQFYIANAGAGILLGSTQSGMNTEVSLYDAVTGELVKANMLVLGGTEARPTIFGAAAIKSPEQELDIITDDLARNMKIAIFGE